MIKIVEVGPRDGLQNETAPVPTEVKIAFVDALSQTGVQEIEASAFVSPAWVPQLSDAAQVFAGIARREGVVYSALVPNRKGLEGAMRANVDKVSVFTSASETFNQKNINTSIAGSLERFEAVIQEARPAGIPVRGYLSTAFWCAFEGRIPPDDVVSVAERLVEIGISEVSISDTIGKATPDEVRALLDRLLVKLAPTDLAMHFHDTYGRGVANVLAAYTYGIRTFDASAGGLGGCPYAPGATGNVATEAVVEALAANGEGKAIDREGIVRARGLLDPYLTNGRRRIPDGGSPFCAACPYNTGPVCCERHSVPA